MLRETYLYHFYHENLLKHYHLKATFISSLLLVNQIHPFSTDLCSALMEQKVSFIKVDPHHQRNQHQTHHLNSLVFDCFIFELKEEMNSFIVKVNFMIILKKLI